MVVNSSSKHATKMANHTAFYNGILYQVEYKPQLSNNDYTKHHVYHIKTDQDDYNKARQAIASIMEDILGLKQGSSWSKGLWQLKYKQEQSMCVALHPYYEFSYDETLDRYVYVYVEPYDD